MIKSAKRTPHLYYMNPLSRNPGSAPGNTDRIISNEGLDGGGGVLVFTIHKKFSPLFISLKFWVIH